MKILDLRNLFSRLAMQLVEDGKTDKAKEVMNKCLTLMPKDKMPYDYKMLPVVSALYASGMTSEAEKVSMEMADEYQQISSWLSGLASDGFREDREFGLCMSVVGYLAKIAEVNGSKKTAEYIDNVYQQISGESVFE